MSDADPDPTRVEQTSVFVAPSGTPPPGEDLPPTGGRGTPPPDRRGWILGALVAVILLLLVLVLVLQDDDDDNETADSSSTTTEQVSSTTATSTTVPTSSTTEAEASTTTAAPAVTVPPDECAEAGEGAAQPGLAASAVFDAWVRGDQACAAELMTAPALAELFSRDGTDAHDEFQGCTEEEVPDPHADCAFTYEGGTTHYLMNFSDTSGWQVFDITQVAD